MVVSISDLSDRSIPLAQRLESAVLLGKDLNGLSSSWLLGWLLGNLPRDHVLTVEQLGLLRDLLQEENSATSSKSANTSLQTRSQFIILLLTNRVNAGVDEEVTRCLVSIGASLRKTQSFRPQLESLVSFLEVCSVQDELQQVALGFLIRELDRTVNPRRVFDFTSQKILPAFKNSTTNTYTKRVISFLFQPHHIPGWCQLATSSSTVELPEVVVENENVHEPAKKKRKKNKKENLTGESSCFNAHQYNVLPNLVKISPNLLPIAYQAFAAGSARFNSNNKKDQQPPVSPEFGWFYLVSRLLLRELESTSDDSKKLELFTALANLWTLVKEVGAFRLREDPKQIQSNSLRSFRDLLISKLQSDRTTPQLRSVLWKGLIAVLNLDVSAIEERVEVLLELVGSEKVGDEERTTGAIFMGRVLVAYARLGDIGRLWSAMLDLLKKNKKSKQDFCMNQTFLSSISEAVPLAAFPQIQEVWTASLKELTKSKKIKSLSNVFGALLKGIVVQEQNFVGLRVLFEDTIKSLFQDCDEERLHQFVSPVIIPLVDLGRRMEGWLRPPTLPAPGKNEVKHSGVMGEIRTAFNDQHSFHDEIDTLLLQVSDISTLTPDESAAIAVRLLRCRAISCPNLFAVKMLNCENNDDNEKVTKSPKKIAKKLFKLLKSHPEIKSVIQPHLHLLTPFDNSKDDILSTLKLPEDNYDDNIDILTNNLASRSALLISNASTNLPAAIKSLQFCSDTGPAYFSDPQITNEILSSILDGALSLASGHKESEIITKEKLVRLCLDVGLVITQAQVGRLTCVKDKRVSEVHGIIISLASAEGDDAEFVRAVEVGQKLIETVLDDPIVYRKKRKAEDIDENKNEILESSKIKSLLDGSKIKLTDYLSKLFKSLPQISTADTPINTIPSNPIPELSTEDLTSSRQIYIWKMIISVVGPVTPNLLPGLKVKLDMQDEGRVKAILGLVSEYVNLRQLNKIMMVQEEKQEEPSSSENDDASNASSSGSESEEEKKSEHIKKEQKIEGAELIHVLKQAFITCPSVEHSGLDLITALCALPRPRTEEKPDVNEISLQTHLLELCHSRLHHTYNHLATNASHLEDLISLAMTQLPSERKSNTTTPSSLIKLNQCLAKLSRAHGAYGLNVSVQYFAKMVHTGIAKLAKCKKEERESVVIKICSSLHGLALVLQTEVHGISPKAFEASIFALTSVDSTRIASYTHEFKLGERNPSSAVLSSIMACHSLSCLRGLFGQSLRSGKKVSAMKSDEKKTVSNKISAVASARQSVERSLLRHCDSICSLVKSLPTGNFIWPVLLDTITQSVLLLFGTNDFAQWLRTPESMLLVIRHYQECIFKSIGGRGVEDACHALVRMWGCFIHGGVLLRSSTDQSGSQARVAKSTRRLLPRLVGDFLHSKRSFPGAEILVKRWPVLNFDKKDHTKMWTDAMQALSSGLHDIFELLSSRDKQQLYVQLDPALKEMMKDLYQDFDKHYKWRGQV